MMLQPAVSAAPAKVNLFDCDRPDLEQFFTHLGEKPFRGEQLLQWAHQRGITDFRAMSNIAKPLRERLQEIAEFRPPQVVERHESDDGTRKWVLQLDSGNHIETVFIPDDGRYTLCVSSQIGCTLNCSFCATARQGFNRNLSVAEIIGQLWLAEHSLRTVSAPELPEHTDRLITNIVFMGMGEPLLNFDNVVKAIRLMQDDFAYGLSWRRITVSTAGVVPMIDRLKQECAASLAVSLHAPDDALRNELVPLNRKYPIAELLAACQRYLDGENRRKITFEYVLLKGINDTPRHAHALVKLLRGIPSKVNLIPFNPFPAAQYECSTVAAREQFHDILTQAGYITLTRKTRGDDINAACGQLAGKVQDRTRRSQRLKAETVS